MFQHTTFIKAEDLRQHPKGGGLHVADQQCSASGCARVTVAIAPKIDEPGMGAVVRDATGTYLHVGSVFTNHWRRVPGSVGKDLVTWEALADDVELVRPTIPDTTPVAAQSPSGWLFTLPRTGGIS